jgi:PAS domain S-box-containing protein
MDRASDIVSGGLHAYLATALDCVIVADAAGRVVEFNPAAERTFGYSRDEALGRTLAELIVPPSLRTRHELAFARYVETGEETLFGQRLELMGLRADGSEFPVELAFSRVQSEPLLICGALRDLSEQKRAERNLRELAEEQAALLRVATLVAEGARPDDVFAAVTKEVAQLLDVPMVEMVRYDSERSATTVADWGPVPYPPGTPMPIEGPSVTRLVLDTGRPARIDDYDVLSGTLAELSRELGIRSAVGVPILVEGQVWGAIMPASTDLPLPADTEVRLAHFTELISTAISNAATRAELIASRARIVAAGDEARRRLERNLHDGTQQRLVALGLDIEALKSKYALSPMKDELNRLQHDLDSVLEDIREISHGLHPALLSQAGLKSAIKALARRSPGRVELDLAVDQRLPASIEIAAYYVVSEALANSAKHAAASLVRVVGGVADDRLRMTISDDGVGGAVFEAGSGLTGLVDRVEALGGRITLESRRGAGTTIAMILPLADPSTERNEAAGLALRDDSE